MRVTARPASRKRRRRILKLAKGYVGGRHRLIRTATEAVMRAQTYAYRHRRLKKRDFRRLWITRLSAAAGLHGLQYSRLINGLKKAGILLDRKQLSELAIHDPNAFAGIVDKAKAALSA
ncbi:MAG: 50S ribosomal protein L20 [Planctomycetes bacterium]|jgi:large subunit ribosomal protein L20|nr:50S ribosomal protein L20 [Planctomycetota bacterium]MDP6423333.1 50S ribosomal protein L20 [Planctomycetota bacterium]